SCSFGYLAARTSYRCPDRCDLCGAFPSCGEFRRGSSAAAPWVCARILVVRHRGDCSHGAMIGWAQRSATAARHLREYRVGHSRGCIMARIKGLEPQQAGWLTRLLYWFTRRSLRQRTGQDRLPEPVKILAHQPALLRAVGGMERVQAAA